MLMFRAVLRSVKYHQLLGNTGTDLGMFRRPWSGFKTPVYCSIFPYASERDPKNFASIAYCKLF